MSKKKMIEDLLAAKPFPILYNDLSVASLKTILRALELPVDGLKSDLASRLLASLSPADRRARIRMAEAVPPSVLDSQVPTELLMRLDGNTLKDYCDMKGLLLSGSIAKLVGRLAAAGLKYWEMRADDMRVVLFDAGLSKTGKKEDLAERLRDYFAGGGRRPVAPPKPKYEDRVPDATPITPEPAPDVVIPSTVGPVDAEKLVRILAWADKQAPPALLEKIITALRSNRSMLHDEEIDCIRLGAVYLGDIYHTDKFTKSSDMRAFIEREAATWTRVEFERHRLRHFFEPMRGGGYRFKAFYDPHVDHILPKAYGGIDHPRNYALMSGKLNIYFGDRMDSDEKLAVVGKVVRGHVMRFARQAADASRGAVAAWLSTLAPLGAAKSIKVPSR